MQNVTIQKKAMLTLTFSPHQNTCLIADSEHVCDWRSEWGQAEHQAFPTHTPSGVYGTHWNFINLVTLTDQNLCCDKMAKNTRKSKCQRNRMIRTNSPFILTFKHWAGSDVLCVCVCVCAHAPQLKWSLILMDLVIWPQGKLFSRCISPSHIISPWQLCIWERVMIAVKVSDSI